MLTKVSNREEFNSRAETKTLEEKCQILDIWNVLSRRWSLLILKNLSIKNVVRFNELKRSLKGISSTVLSDRLTYKTKDLELILQSLDRWCEKWESKK